MPRGQSEPKADGQRKGWLSRAPAAAATPPATRSRRTPSRLRLLLVGLVVLAAVALWIVPQLQVWPARERVYTEAQLTPAERLQLEKELFEAENSARATLALILAAGGLLLGLGSAWRRYEISRELRSHERFASAIEQLTAERSDGSPRTETRLGGIYALERLAAESEREYWPIMEVLTAYVRENAAWKPSAASAGPPRPGADIQAILAVLGRRKAGPASTEKRLLDLRDTDLRATNLSGIRLEGVTMHGAHLEGADLTRASLTRSNLREASLAGASLTEVDLEGASLSRANLEGARLNGANLKGADLSGANLHSADLWEANLRGCNLKDADLRGADLSQCNLEEAILWRADLQDAVLTETRLRETHLERANLTNVSGLTWEQGEDAYTDENTILPAYLLPEGAEQPAPPARPAAARTRPVAPPAATPKPAAPAPVAGKVVAEPPPPPSPVTSNVVELKQPKKAKLPKHRKQGLVKPA
jgi:uncharacterized protein YjbI with pentapeptide repeats